MSVDPIYLLPSAADLARAHADHDAAEDDAAFLRLALGHVHMLAAALSDGQNLTAWKTLRRMRAWADVDTEAEAARFVAESRPVANILDGLRAEVDAAVARYVAACQAAAPVVELPAPVAEMADAA